jgi:hypothetical protein
MHGLNVPHARQIGALDLNTDIGWQKYRGLKLAARHRSTTGVSLNASYNLSKCEGTTTATTFNQTSAGYSIPDDPDFDAGYCDQDRTHLGTLNAGSQTPEVAPDRGAGSTSSGVDRALIGSHSSVQRPDLVSDDIYGPGKDASDLEPGQRIDNYFDRAAFTLAPLGELGDAKRNLAVGPGVLAGRHGALEAHPGGNAAAGAAVRDVQLAQHLQLGKSRHQLQLGSVRAHHHAGRRSAHPAFGVKYDF